MVRKTLECNSKYANKLAYLKYFLNTSSSELVEMSSRKLGVGWKYVKQMVRDALPVCIAELRDKRRLY